jgi:hypothetical protein
MRAVRAEGGDNGAEMCRCLVLMTSGNGDHGGRGTETDGKRAVGRGGLQCWGHRWDGLSCPTCSLGENSVVGFRELSRFFLEGGAVLGLELRAYALSYSTSPFCVCVLGIFKIGSYELFAWAGFEPRSS